MEHHGLRFIIRKMNRSMFIIRKMNRSTKSVFTGYVAHADLTGRDPRRALSDPGALYEVCVKISFKPTGLYGPQSHRGSKSSAYLIPQNRGQETAGNSFSWSPRGKAFIWQGQHEGQPGPHLSAVLHRVFPPSCCSPFLHVENSNTAQFSFGKIIVFL